MSFTFVTPSLPNSNIKVRWREQYGSSALNKKFAGIIPAGIYRGFNLSTSGSNNTVTVAPDATFLDHLAVYETSDGWSLTFRNPDNTTYTLALTDASLLSQTVIITLFLDYQEGVVTSAQFIAYTLSEYNALSAALRGELIVLGTVVNPAAGNLIISSSITSDRRTMASLSPRVLLWKPLLVNSAFERSPNNHPITGLEVEGWAFTNSWETDSTAPDTGTRCVQFNAPSASTFSESFKQLIGTNVVAGQRIKVKIRKKVVGAASAGTGAIIVGYTKTDGGTATELASSFVINGTDGSYQTVESTLVAPSGALTLTYVGIRLTSAVYGSSGVKLRIDNITALLEPVSVDDMFTIQDSRWKTPSATALLLEDATSATYGDIGAAIYFKKSLPTSTEGEVIIGRKDLAGTGNSPALSLPGRVVNLGSASIANEADALTPRIDLPISTAGGTTEYTLVMQGTPSGGDVMRVYFGADASYVVTKNSHWDGAAWINDNGNPVSRLQLDDKLLVTGTLGNQIEKQTHNLFLNKDGNHGSYDDLDVFNVAGRVQKLGTHYFDDFFTALAGTYVFTLGTGGAAVTQVGHSAHVQAGTGGIGGTSSMHTRGTSLQTWDKLNLTTFWTRLKFTDVILADDIRKFGLGDGAATIQIGFTAIGGGVSVIGPAGSTGTGFTATVDTYYYFLLRSTSRQGISGQGTLEWWISTTDNFDNGVVTHGTFSAVGSNTSSQIGPFFFAEGPTGTPGMVIDAYEVWSNFRPA